MSTTLHYLDKRMAWDREKVTTERPFEPSWGDNRELPVTINKALLPGALSPPKQDTRLSP